MDEQKENEINPQIPNVTINPVIKPPLIENSETREKPIESGHSTTPVIEKKKPYRRYHGRNGNHKKFFQQKATTGPNLNLANKIISVIIPSYNEEESIVELSISLKKVFERMHANYEVIFIDDGSSDDSFQKIREVNRLNNRFKCIKFKRNYGKSAALSEGFKAAKGDIIITMDADLQDDPEEIPSLIQKLNQGYDMVSGWKKKRYDPFIKRISSKFFNFVTSKLVGLKLHDYNCGLKAYKKEVTKNIKIYGEMHRYIPAIAYISGYRITEITVTHHPRKFGKTKFGSSRFIKGLLDLLTVLFTSKFIKRPLHFFGVIGIISFIAGFGILIYLTILKFFESVPISNRPLFMIGILFAIVGIQFISLGLIAEMITKTSLENDNIIIEKNLT
jgi:glycosyltransferase involved in cell wall biosynthesis